MVPTCQLQCSLSHDKDEPLVMQDSRFQNMHRPAHVTARIKEQQRMASAGVRGRQPDKALLGFYASMEHLCSVAGPLLNHINLSAIVTATAQLWTLAQANSSFKPSADKVASGLTHLYSSTLLQLEPMLPNVEAQQISNILWSSARLGLSPDAFVPGMTDALAAKLLQLTKDEARRQPSAQHCANFLWALATLGHALADKGFLDVVCNYFARLIKHQDHSKRPNARDCANIMWALGETNHSPPDGAASAVLEWFTRPCKLPGQEPNAQDLSNTLFACAVLHLKVKGHVSLALVNGLLRLDRAHGLEQDYCNAAWDLAVSGILSSEMFLALLERLRSWPTAESAHDALPRQGLFQLYQALDSLQPLPSAATQQLQEMVTRLGARPLLDERTAAELSASKHLSAALEQLGLTFTANVPLSGYWADAVLQPQDDNAAPVVVVVDASDYIRNKDKRCVLQSSVSLRQYSGCHSSFSLHGIEYSCHSAYNEYYTPFMLAHAA